VIDRLLNVDRRIVFVFVAIAVIATTLTDLTIPIVPTPDVTSLYDEIEALKGKENATVLMSFDYGPSSAPELQPVALNVLRHCFVNDIKVVAMALWPDGVGLAEAAFDSIAHIYAKESTRDWAFLGYKPGWETLIINMGQDIYSAFNVDADGVPTLGMEAMSGVDKLGDFDFVVVLAAGNTLDRTVWIPYAVDRYRVRLGGAVTAVMSPDMFPYLQSGQLKGLISGLAGASEYETLMHAPGSAVRGMVPQSAVHLVIIMFIVFGNVIYFLQRRRERSERRIA
jgi:hypothetical protein